MNVFIVRIMTGLALYNYRSTFYNEFITIGTPVKMWFSDSYINQDDPDKPK